MKFSHRILLAGIFCVMALPASASAFQTYAVRHDRFHGFCINEHLWVVDSNEPTIVGEASPDIECFWGAADGPQPGQLWIAASTSCVLWDVVQRLVVESRGANGPTYRDVAFVASTQTLFATDETYLYEISQPEGATPIGSFGGVKIRAVGSDFMSEDLLGLSFEDGTLYRIDPATAQLTAIGPTGFPLGSAFGDVYVDPSSGEIVASHYTSLYAIDRAKGSATLIRDYYNIWDSMMGLGGVVIAPSSIEPWSWGRVKSVYRERVR